MVHPVGTCQNLPKQLDQRMSSIDSLKSCIKIYAGLGCKGDSETLGVAKIDDLGFYVPNWDNRVRSVYNYDCNGQGK